MDKLIRRILNNEKGNMTLLMISILGCMLLLSVIILNFSKVLAVKEQADTTTQQASLAASSVIYDHIEESINEYDREAFLLNPLRKPLSKKVEDWQRKLSRDSKYREYSENEINTEAIDLAIKEEFSSDQSSLLRSILDNNLKELEPQMMSVAREVIQENKGKLDGAEMRFEHNRIYIKAANEFKATKYDTLLEGFHKKLYQESAGPEIDFLSELSIWKNTISLEDGNIEWN